MAKLLLCILGMFLTCSAMLQLRQTRLAHRHAIHQINVRLHQSQATLWNQQLDIAALTTPQTLVRQVRASSAAPAAEPVREASGR
ncbi:MAG: hypothetical protein ACK4PI_10155 [Tepidisphaerales bacterium]